MTWATMCEDEHQNVQKGVWVLLENRPLSDARAAEHAAHGSLRAPQTSQVRRGRPRTNRFAPAHGPTSSPSKTTSAGDILRFSHFEFQKKCRKKSASPLLCFAQEARATKSLLLHTRRCRASLSLATQAHRQTVTKGQWHRECTLKGMTATSYAYKARNISCLKGSSGVPKVCHFSALKSSLCAPASADSATRQRVSRKGLSKTSVK